MRLQGQQPYSKAVDTAPFATETKDGSVGAVAQGSEEEGQLRMQSRLTVQRYRSRLEEKRKQAGIITQPSSQLQEAEKALAEVRYNNSSHCYSETVCNYTGISHAGGIRAEKS